MVLLSIFAITACSGGDPAISRTGGGSPASSAPVSSTLWSTGLDQNGQLGRAVAASGPSISAELTPVEVSAGMPVVSIAAGGRHSLAVLADGTVLTWGANDHGQLGQGTPGTNTAAGLVIAPDSGRGVLRDVVSVAADTDFSMALRKDGTVVTWGTGDGGQRGNGANLAPPYPTPVLAPGGQGPLRNVKQIAADGRTELALLNDGRVVAWGVNTYGMLGDGTTTDRNVPVFVVAATGTGELSGVQQVAVGGQNGLALLTGGTVLSWGHNDLGQLGDGTRQDRHRPGPVLGVGGKGTLSDITQITAAEKHAFALRDDGTALAWGNNTAGQLGDGSTQLRTSPVEIVGDGEPDLTGITELDAGEAYGVAVLKDGSLQTWGAGGKGQLGSGARTSRNRPGPVTAAGNADGTDATLGPVTAVAAGERHLLVLTATG